MAKTFSQKKIAEYKDTIEKLEARNAEIDQQVSIDRKWIKEAEAEQKARLARIDKNTQEKWQTEGQLKIIKEWLEAEQEDNAA